MKNAAIASSHPAWDLDGQLHCECGHASPDQASHLEHVVTVHPLDSELAGRILSERQWRTYMERTAQVSKVHVFERAGLGKAPFRFVGLTEAKYQAGPGAPIQPGSSCDYCGEAIMEVCHIRSADGRNFKVGNVCVGKTGDAGLRKTVAAAIRERRNEATHRRQDEKIAAGAALLERPGVREILAAEPHPYGTGADPRPFFLSKTRLDWVEWMLHNAGRRGKVDVVTYLQRRFGEV